MLFITSFLFSFLVDIFYFIWNFILLIWWDTTIKPNKLQSYIIYIFLFLTLNFAVLIRKFYMIYKLKRHYYFYIFELFPFRNKFDFFYIYLLYNFLFNTFLKSSWASATSWWTSSTRKASPRTALRILLPSHHGNLLRLRKNIHPVWW